MSASQERVLGNRLTLLLKNGALSNAVTMRRVNLQGATDTWKRADQEKGREMELKPSILNL